VNGEFAISVYDRKKKTHYLFRDRRGTNLMYYRIFDGELFFASELKALMLEPPKLNKKAFYEYMTFQFTISPHTIIEGISSLRP